MGWTAFGGQGFFLNNKNPFLELNAFSRTFWPIWTRTWTNWYYRCFLFPWLESSHLLLNMQNRRYLHDFQIAIFFLLGWVGGGWGGGELSYLEDFVVDVWTWKTFFEKRHWDTSIMRTVPIAAIAVLRFAGQAFYYLDIYHIEHANDRQLQQWARHVMKIRHRSRDLQMLLLGKRSLWTSMLSWIILLRWLQPKQWYFFFVGQPIMPRYVCVPETPGFDVRPSGKGQGPCWGGLLYVHVPPKTLLWTHPAKKAGTGCIHFQMLISRKLTWQSNITIFNRSYIFKRVGFPLSCWFSRV